MMWTMKPMFGKRQDVVIESGCFVLKGLVGMLADGVYEKTAIKKKIIGST